MALRALSNSARALLLATVVTGTCLLTAGGSANAFFDAESCVRQRDTLRARAADFYQDMLMSTVPTLVSEGVQQDANRALAACTELLFTAEQAYVASMKNNTCALDRYDAAVDSCRVSRDRILESHQRMP